MINLAEAPAIAGFALVNQRPAEQILGTENLAMVAMAGSRLTLTPEGLAKAAASPNFTALLSRVGDIIEQQNGFRPSSYVTKEELMLTVRPSGYGTGDSRALPITSSLYQPISSPDVFIKAFDNEPARNARIQFYGMAYLHQKLREHQTGVSVVAPYALFESPSRKHITIILQRAAGEQLSTRLGEDDRLVRTMQRHIVSRLNRALGTRALLANDLHAHNIFVPAESVIASDTIEELNYSLIDQPRIVSLRERAHRLWRRFEEA